MLLLIPGILSADDLSQVREEVNAGRFVDGRSTAGAVASKVKNNEQLDASSTHALTRFVRDALMRSDAFMLAARPKAWGPMLFSRYTPGMAYGPHVDNPVMEGQDGPIRVDLSFTLFLSDPRDYEGGELVMELAAGGQAIKLEAGDCILYPSTTLHRVEAVGAGERLAAVGWVQSRIRRAEEREILFDLATARANLPNTAEVAAAQALLDKTQANLIRLWADG